MKRFSTIFSITFLLFFLLVRCSNDNKGYTINGDLGAFEMDSIFLYLEGSGMEIPRPIASAAVKDGKFILTGRIDMPRKAFVGSIKKEMASEIILENADYTYKFDGKYGAIKGGKIHNAVLGYVNDMAYVNLVDEYNQKTEEAFYGLDMQDEEAVEKARNMVDVYSKKVTDYEDANLKKVMASDHDDLSKLFAVMYSYDWKNYPVERRFELLDNYEKNHGKHPDIKFYRDYLQQGEEQEDMQNTVANGNMFKPLSALDINNELVDLSQVVANNKYTILEFWASWCSPCRAEIPNLKKAYEKFKDQGLEIYSISLDKKKEDWKRALEEEQTTWINVVSNDAFEDSMVKSYGIAGIPASFLISKEGIIVASNDELREFELDKTLTKIFETEK